MPAEDFHIGVVSAGRSYHVPAMTMHLDGLPHTWYVPKGQGADYLYAGAALVVEVDGNLSVQRNAVLADAFAVGKTAVEFNDDLVQLRWTDDGNAVSHIDVPAALRRLDEALEATGFCFAGTALTTNPYFYREPVSTRHLIMAHLMMMRPSPLRFDESMRLKEDFDYTVQHLRAFGGVARVNGLLANFRHYEKRGGCGPYRTAAEEQRHADYLVAKWPGIIEPHRTREHEVRLVWPPKAA